jgi:hypothetical protein
MAKGVGKPLQVTTEHQLYPTRVLGGQHFSNDEPSMREATQILARRLFILQKRKGKRKSLRPSFSRHKGEVHILLIRTAHEYNPSVLCYAPDVRNAQHRHRRELITPSCTIRPTRKCRESYMLRVLVTAKSVELAEEYEMMVVNTEAEDNTFIMNKGQRCLWSHRQEETQ